MYRVIYINTTGHMSGAAVSMSESIKVLRTMLCPILLTPKGRATAFLRSSFDEIYEVPWLSQFDHTRHGRYRGVRWLIALRELVLLPMTAVSVWNFCRKVGSADFIHLNEITGIIPALLTKYLLKAPLIVHVRANMGDQSRGMRSKVLWNLVRRHAFQVICIDETVRSSLPPSIPARVIHNSLNLDRINDNVSSSASLFFKQDGGDTVNIGIVGTIIRVKGIFEFVEAAIAICRRRKDVRFFVVGSGLRTLKGVRSFMLTKLGLAEDVTAMIAKKIAEADLANRIIMTGYISDLRSVYEGLDLLCFPSHYDAPGRPIFEAAFFGRPSIVAIDKPLPDTLLDGVTGIAIKAKDSRGLEAAILKLVDDPTLRSQYGEAARLLAWRMCNPEINGLQMAEIYQHAVADSEVEAC